MAITALVMIVVAACARPVAAQSQPSAGSRLSESSAFYAVVNGAIGGVTAGVRAWRGHHPVSSAIVAGTAGGVVTYAGMSMVGRRTATRIPGFMLTGVGASIARNVGSGAPALSRITLPVPLGLLDIRRDESVHFQYRLSVTTLAMTGAVLVLRPNGSVLDWRRSVESWTPVFATDNQIRSKLGGHHTDNGEEWFRVVMYARTGSSSPLDLVLRHEAVHVAQEIREETLFSADASDALLAHAGRVGGTARRIVVFDVVRPLAVLDFGVGLTMHATHGTSWLLDTYSEREAYRLSGELPCSADGRTRCSW